MTTIEVEHEDRVQSDDEQVEEHDVDGDVKEPVHEDVVKEEVLNKPVRQLSKSEREKIINEFENGVDNTYYKCHRLKNGSIRITKRTNPLVTDVSKAHEVTRTRIDNKVNIQKLTDNQLLLEHIIDLEKRYEIMRMKHKKLKKRYNKLENDIFEDDSDDIEVREVKYGDSVENSVEPSVEPVKIPVEDVKTKVEQPVEDAVSRQDFRARKAVKPKSWRSVVTSF